MMSLTIRRTFGSVRHEAGGGWENYIPRSFIIYSLHLNLRIKVIGSK
jgi:hypothetical protein